MQTDLDTWFQFVAEFNNGCYFHELLCVNNRDICLVTDSSRDEKFGYGIFLIPDGLFWSGQVVAKEALIIKF